MYIDMSLFGMGMENLESKVFFFQAEDGIRVAQESRGLGDVYKRQSTGRRSSTVRERTWRAGSSG